MPWVERWHEPNFESFLFSCQDKFDVMLLDSSDTLSGQEPYSYLCFHSFAQLRVKAGQLFWNHELQSNTCPWQFLQDKLAYYQLAHDETLPPFQGGVAGYWGYELAQPLENLPKVKAGIQLPDCALNFYATVAAYDHRSQEVILMMTGLPARTVEAREAQALRDRDQWLTSLRGTKQSRGRCTEPWIASYLAKTEISREIQSNFTRAAYCQAVLKMQSFIREGDIFQANLTQQFQSTLPSNVDRLSWYGLLREQNPAPFSAFMQLSATEWLLSSSPERFIRLQGKQVQTEPIKGTRKRVLEDVVADEQMQQALIHSEKDNAENVMIVDLMRNDLSRVCLPGTVKVKELCGLRTFATVHHLVSVVCGEIDDSTHAIQVLQVAFPPGSVTGAPKLKAMERIAELEQHNRGPYCGCLGYISFSGYLDTAVTIRTYVVKDDTVFFGAGGAIVLASDPEEEYEESLLKAARLKSLLEVLV